MPSVFQVLHMRLPVEFTEKMQPLLGEEWEAFLQSCEKEAHKALRFNMLKPGVTVERQAQILKELKITEPESVPWTKNAFYYDGSAQPGKHPYHEAGLYYIQEPSAMSVAALLSPQPGERVLDLCAAPGGKTTQMASAMQQDGLLIANEIHPLRVKALSQNIERMGIRNAIVTNEESNQLLEHFPEYFHRILVDAPCSGEGMFRKNPEAIAEWSQEQVMACAKRQQEILENAAHMLLPGGVLSYSTCTFSQEENEMVVDSFLDVHKEFVLEKNLRLWPHRVKGEGHFVAILRKEDNSLLASDMSQNCAINRRKRKKEVTDWKTPDKDMLRICREFTSSTLTKETGEWILKGSLVLFGDQLYRLPENTPSFSGLHVLRPGLHIGTFKKNRFEPSHALALTLGRSDVKNNINFLAEDERIVSYYHGEALPTNGEKGWQLVCIDGYSAGWGKLSGGVLKNHYPKGLRKGA